MSKIKDWNQTKQRSKLGAPGINEISKLMNEFSIIMSVISSLTAHPQLQLMSMLSCLYYQ